MDRTLQQAFAQGLDAARRHWAKRQLMAAFSRLERAYVLGQGLFLWHLRVHLWMLRVGWAQKEAREICGQLWRLFLTPLGHLTGACRLAIPAGPMSVPLRHAHSHGAASDARADIRAITGT